MSISDNSFSAFRSSSFLDRWLSDISHAFLNLDRVHGGFNSRYHLPSNCIRHGLKLFLKRGLPFWYALCFTIEHHLDDFAICCCNLSLLVCGFVLHVARLRKAAYHSLASEDGLIRYGLLILISVRNCNVENRPYHPRLNHDCARNSLLRLLTDFGHAFYGKPFLRTCVPSQRQCSNVRRFLCM